MLLVFAFVFSFAACSKTSEDNNNDVPLLTDIHVSLDWMPTTYPHAMFFALKNGYYEEAGLNVTIVQPPENGATQACAAGQAQFAIDFQDILAAAFASDTPLGVTAVAAVIQHNTSGIISSKGQGMERPAGLTGKNHLTRDSPIELATLENVVNAHGGGWRRVTI